MEPAKTFQRTSEKNFPRVGANSFPNCLFKQPAMFHSSETNSSLMYLLHKLECLAFRRTSHRYLDFRSKQHSSSSGFSPWPPFYGRVISCILPKKKSWQSVSLEWVYKQHWSSFGTFGFLPKQWPVAAQLQSLPPHWSAEKKLIRGEKFWSSADKIWSHAEIFYCREKIWMSAEKLELSLENIIPTAPTQLCQLLPLFRKCLSVQISTWWPPALQQWLKSYCFR